MAKRKYTSVTPEMNMTPLIDVVFQLIIFFMLVNNIIAEQMVEMVVPDLENARTHELTEGDHIMVSIAPAEFTSDDRKDDPLAFDGDAQYVQVGKRQFSLDDLEGITNELRDWKATRRSEVEVLLRADAALFYNAVAPVMAAITAADIQTVNLVALMPQDKRKQR